MAKPKYCPEHAWRRNDELDARGNCIACFEGRPNLLKHPTRTEALAAGQEWLTQQRAAEHADTIVHEPRLARQYSKSELNPLGKPLVIYVQGACTCGWRGVSYSLHSSIEGWTLSERDAVDHANHPREDKK